MDFINPLVLWCVCMFILYDERHSQGRIYSSTSHDVTTSQSLQSQDITGIHTSQIPSKSGCTGHTYLEILGCKGHSRTTDSSPLMCHGCVCTHNLLAGLHTIY